LGNTYNSFWRKNEHVLLHEMNSRHLLVQLVKDQLPLAKKSETGLQHMLGGKEWYSTTHINNTGSKLCLGMCKEQLWLPAPPAGAQLPEQIHSV
jgi:hypothetical protein